MDKRNLVFNHVLKKDDFDEMQNAAERAIDGVGKVVGKGILTGLNVSVSTSAVSVSPGVCFDGLGRRIEVAESLSISAGVFSRPSPGKVQWCGVCVQYKTVDQGEVIDGNNDEWPERVLDSYENVLQYGEEFPVNGNEGIFPVDDALVVIGYIRLEHGRTLNQVGRINGFRLDTLAKHEEAAITSTQTVHGIRQGHGRGFDADKLDGQDGAYYRSASNLTGTIPSARLSANYIRDKLKSVDGSGSGIDADLLDGAHRDTDGNLAGNSNNSIPTERAVKTYVDAVSTDTEVRVRSYIHNYSKLVRLWTGSMTNYGSVYLTESIANFRAVLFIMRVIGRNGKASAIIPIKDIVYHNSTTISNDHVWRLASDDNNYIRFRSSTCIFYRESRDDSLVAIYGMGRI